MHRPTAPAPELPAPLKDDLCLDFANTRYWRGSAAPTERLQRAEDVIDWCASSGLVLTAQAEALKARLRPRPKPGDAFLREAIALRETVYAVCATLAAGRVPREDELAALNAALAAAPPRRALRRRASGKGYGWIRPNEFDRPADLLAPVLWSAGDLLAGPRLERLRRCANDACLWLFLDDSKSGNRRWCAMSACGNRAKAHRFYMRQKSG